MFLPVALLFDYGLYPLLSWLMHMPILPLLGIAVEESTLEEVDRVWVPVVEAWVLPAGWALFLVCIVFGLLVTNVLGTVWYQEIADATYALDGSVKAQPPAQAWELLAQLVYRVLVVLAYVAVQTGVRMVVALLCPFVWVGVGIDVLLTAWYFAFYCFEYKWVNLGFDLGARIRITQARWAYFAGFGLPFTLLCYFFSFATSNALFFLLYPIFIILATQSRPHPVFIRDVDISPLPTSLPIFTVPSLLAYPLIRLIETKLFPRFSPTRSPKS